MPKLTTLEAAIVGEVVSIAGVLLAVGLITNATDQLIVALAPAIIANAGVIAIAVVNAIHAHTVAVVAAIKASVPVAKVSTRGAKA